MTKAKPELPVRDGLARLNRTGSPDQPEIDRGGGNGAGLITGVSLATVGEARGHRLWLDQETLSQIVAMGSKETGLKCRFTHPGMSSDGLGRHLGRLRDLRIEGEKVLGDLHFAQSAHETPDGDLADYVMTLTEEDPAAAGLSIVFYHDWEAEDEFYEANQEEYEYQDSSGKTHKGTRFKSPDPRNENNYHHVRIRDLRAADVVDEPAANPGGMFDAVSLPRDVDQLLSYATGISAQKPQASAFGVDGDRASQFLARWLDQHGLTLGPKEKAMADEPAKETTPAQPTREEFTAEMNRFVSEFGAENGAKWFGENKSFEDAVLLHVKELHSQLAAEKEARQQAEERLASLALGEDKEVETGSEDSSKKKVTFAEYTSGKS